MGDQSWREDEERFQQRAAILLKLLLLPLPRTTLDLLALLLVTHQQLSHEGTLMKPSLIISKED
jgi:hypothetical protein